MSFSELPDSAAEVYRRALREMTHRYEHLVRGLSLLRRIDTIDHPEFRLEEICDKLIDTIAEGLEAENCSLMLVDRVQEALVLWSAKSPGDETPATERGATRFRLGEGIAGQVAATGRQIRIDDIQQTDAFVPLPSSPINVRALMCCPLKVGSRVVGVLNLSHSRPGFFSAESEGIMGLVAERCARLLAIHIAHHEQRQSAEYYQLLSERIQDGVLVFDRTGSVINANHAVSRVLGFPERVPSELGFAWDANVAETDRDSFLVHRGSLLQGQARSSLEYQVVLPEGETRIIEEQCSAVVDSNGQADGFVCVLRDVTEQRRIEREFRELENQLIHAQKMEAIGELAGGVAHDFNNLLTGVLGNITLARSQHDPECVQKLLDRAEAAANRAAQLTRQLLLLSRRSDADRTTVSVAQVVEDVADISQTTFDRRIAIEVRVRSKLHPVLGDANQIHQVLLNLCVNARDALMSVGQHDPQRPLRLTISAEAVTLGEEARRNHVEASAGNYVRITVADNGPGMDEATGRRIFEPFFTTKPEGEGTGLGLSIVYGIVKQHGGWVHLATAPGLGASFSVYLRAAGDAAPPRQREPQKGTELLRGTETILVIDDEAVILDLARSILQPLGYTVLTAGDGRAGLEEYEAHADRIDGVLLDLSMPEMSGIEVLKRIRRMNADAVVIVSSGHVNMKHDDFPEPYRASGFLGKPYTQEDLAQTIREVLGPTPAEVAVR